MNNQARETSRGLAQSAALRSIGNAEIMPADHFEKLGAGIGAAAQELQPARKTAFLRGHDERYYSTLSRGTALCASQRHV